MPRKKPSFPAWNETARVLLERVGIKRDGMTASTRGVSTTTLVLVAIDSQPRPFSPVIFGGGVPFSGMKLTSVPGGLRVYLFVKTVRDILS